MLSNNLIKRDTTGAFALIDSLVRHEVKHIFGYPGGAILPIYDELYAWEQEGFIEHILVRHEQGAAHASDAYYRATGNVGVCFATSGPGATNLVTGIATAHMDSVAMVCITGQVGRSFIGTDAFQEVDIFGVTLPVVKHSYVVRNTSDMAKTIAAAFFIAKYGRPGPVLVDIPKDVGLEKFEYVPVNPGDVKLPGCPPMVKHEPKRIAQAANLIRQSSQPLLYVGGGAIVSEAYKEVTELVNYLEIPIATTLMGKGIINETHPLSLGMLGMHGTVYANYAVSECDLLIALGARFDDRVTGKLDEFACHAQVIHVDIDPAEVGKNRTPQVGIVGDVRDFIQDLLNLLKKEGDFDREQVQSWRNRLNRWRDEYPLLVPRNASNLSPQEVISQISSNSNNAYFTTDVGQHQMVTCRYAEFVRSKSNVTSGGLGTMGFALPAALGAKMGAPQREVVAVIGDGGYQMTIQELGTIFQTQAAVKIVVLNNDFLGMVRQWQQLFFDKRYASTEMVNPDFVTIAKGYFLDAKRVDKRKDLDAAVAEMIASDKPYFLEVCVEKEDNVFPMIPTGASVSDIRLK